MSDSEQLAREMRIDVLKMIHQANAQHIASAFSICDILAVLYSKILVFDSKNPNDSNRDFLILSKGHGGSAVYSVLAEQGFFDKSLLATYEQNGGLLSGHVSSHGVPGVEWSTGALGHGLSVACGIALSLKMDGKKNRVFCIIGDGENEEGSNWEAAAFASHFQLSNLMVIIDNNGMQAFGGTDDIMSFSTGLDKKWRSFGFKTANVDGHDHLALEKAFSLREKKRPIVVIAHTTKGKGVPFMENNLKWHYSAPMGAEYDEALSLLEKKK
jgi:transketolase